jgi:glucokinase
VIDELTPARDLNLKAVHLMNDLEAVALPVPALRPQDVVTINKGEAVANGPIAIIAPGTDLRESFLTWGGSQYVAHGSEGGHSDFAPTDEREVCLLQCLIPRFGHVAVERVCSGIGVPNIYEFRRDEEEIPEQPEVAHLIASAKDHTKAIVNAALDPVNPREGCRATIDMLVSIPASESADLALKVLTTVGLYIAGGIAIHFLTLLQQRQFIESFSRKGRFKELVKRIPVHVIMTSAALVGAAAFGLQSLKNIRNNTGAQLSVASV